MVTLYSRSCVEPRRQRIFSSRCNTLALLFLSLRLTSGICRFFSSTENNSIQFGGISYGFSYILLRSKSWRFGKQRWRLAFETGRLPQKNRPSFWGNESRCQSDGVLWWQTLGECHRRFGTWDLAACCWGLEWYSLRLDRVCCFSLVSFDGIGFCGFMKGIRIPPVLLFVSGFPFAEVGCFSKWPSVDQNSCSVSDAWRTSRKTRDGFWNLGCPRCMLDFGQFSHTLSVERREVLGAHTSRGKVGWGLVVNRSHLFGSCLCSFGCRCVHCPFYFHCWRAFWFMQKNISKEAFEGLDFEANVTSTRVVLSGWDWLKWWYWSARTWRGANKLRYEMWEFWLEQFFFWGSQDQKLFSNLCKLGTTM